MIPGLDYYLFRVINRDLNNAVLDILMPFITNPQPFLLPFAIIGIALGIWGGRKGRLVLGAALLLLLASNAVSELLKLWIERPRPCQALATVRVLVGCSGGSFSFPSSHAANVTAQAVLFAAFYRPLAVPLFAVAGAVGYSRVYVGVHYPADVAAGVLVGLLVGVAFVRLVRTVEARLPAADDRRPTADDRWSSG
jgi:undecaprenyl-diphosphatase